VPAEPALKKLAADIGVKGDLEELVHNNEVNAAVLKELIAAGRKGGLAGIELIEGVVLTDEEWTPQNVCDPFLIFRCTCGKERLLIWMWGNRTWSLARKSSTDGGS
jgi:hypothetical protein